MSARVGLPAALLACLALACGNAATWPPEPAPFRAGEEACARCRMLASDARFAVQVRSRGGAVEWFDDLGCLLARGGAPVEPEGVFVRDFAADDWVRGDRGHAVRLPGLDSPMGYGWVVRASEAAARAEGSNVVALSELLLRGEAEADPPPEHAIATTNPDEDRR